MRGWAQIIYALNLDDFTASPIDTGAHADQATGEIHHLRFTRGILKYGGTARQGGRHHQVLSASHCDSIKNDLGAMQISICCTGLDITAVH